MTRHLRPLLNAIQFMTIIPAPGAGRIDEDWLLPAAKFFPLVGALIGLVCAAVFMVASAIWSGAVPAALAICAGVLLTGALHEDGVADTSDGLFGGRSREQRLMIIKDSRIGTYGATALCLSLILRVTVLASIPVSLAPAALIAGHCVGRMAIVLVMSVLPYGGNVDAARLLYPESRISAGAMVVAIAFTALGLSWLVFANVWAALCGLAGAAVCGLFPPRLARRLLGGYTGDILGATQQLAEIGLLLGVAAIAAHGHF